MSLLTAVEPLLCSPEDAADRLGRSLAESAPHGVLRFAVPELAIHAAHGGHDVLASLTFGSPAHVGDPITVNWVPHGCTLSPRFAGELALTRSASAKRCTMELRGSYELPHGRDPADAVISHRLAGAAALCFLKALRERMEAATRGDSLTREYTAVG